MPILPGVAGLAQQNVPAGTKAAPALVHSTPVKASAALGRIGISLDTSGFVPGNEVTVQIQYQLPATATWLNAASVTWNAKSTDIISGLPLDTWDAQHWRDPPFPVGTSYRHEISLVGPGMPLAATFTTDAGALMAQT
jgi:hypothetical protein